MRGNLDRGCRFGRSSGSIPACAGEPRRPAPQLPLKRVYPRVCGGTAMHDFAEWIVQGLSPRVRGNRHVTAPSVVSIGSIPACAGEPTAGLRALNRSRVYPRVCGGTSSANAMLFLLSGLSPRVRGNLGPAGFARNDPGSIPACAGEPIRRARSRRIVRVYPRVCGGTEGP